MSDDPYPPIAPVRIRGVHASQPGTSRSSGAAMARVVVERDAGLAMLAEGVSSDLDRPSTRVAEMILDSCAQMFRGRAQSIRDELAEIWWLGEHGEPREGGGRRARRPYSTLPIGDRVELRDRIGVLLERRVPESMGDVAVLEAELASLLAIPQRAVTRGGADLYRRAEADRRWRTTAASAACVLFAADRAAIAHLGSVRVSRMRDGAVEAVALEHTLRNAHLRDHPDASDETLADYPNVVVKMLGASDGLQAEATTVPVVPGDVFVLTNRGANAIFSPMEIAMTVRARGLDAATYLAERATRNPPNVDGLNVEVVVVEVL